MSDGLCEELIGDSCVHEMPSGIALRAVGDARDAHSYGQDEIVHPIVHHGLLSDQAVIT